VDDIIVLVSDVQLEQVLIELTRVRRYVQCVNNNKQHSIHTSGRAWGDNNWCGVYKVCIMKGGLLEKNSLARKTWLGPSL